MKRRIVAGLIALVLAAAGGALLFRYTTLADERAMAGMTPTPVLVVTEPIAEGTATDKLARSVTLTSLPARAVVRDAVDSLAELQGQVTTVDLKPGEQVLASRFADPASLLAPNEVAVPAGMHELSVQLEPQRVVGGQLEAGDTVGVYLSVEQNEAAFSHLSLHKILVTRVEGATASAEQGDAPGAGNPTSTIMITLAVSGPQAEQVVFAAEFGHIWLSAEPAQADIRGTRVRTKGNLYE